MKEYNKYAWLMNKETVQERAKAINFATNILQILTEESNKLILTVNDKQQKEILYHMSEGFIILSTIVNKLIEENMLVLDYLKILTMFQETAEDANNETLKRH